MISSLHDFRDLVLVSAAQLSEAITESVSLFSSIVELLILLSARLCTLVIGLLLVLFV